MRKSTEAETAFKGLIELCVADRLKVNNPVIQTAIAWALIRLGGKYESNKVSAKETGQSPREKARSADNGGGELPVKDAKTLMEWALSHGKEFPSSWVRKQAKLGDTIITDEIAVKAYQDIKALMNW